MKKVKNISIFNNEGGRTKYDWQQFDPLTDPPPVGLVLESKDVFENRSTIEYDDYQMFPLNAKQWLNSTDYLETTAEYDYRVMQAYKITDPNDNITEFDFSPLGLLTATAVIGKGTEGDYKAAIGTFHERFAPSVRMEYDFFAFVNDGDPVWVRTIQREQHWQDDPDPDSPTIVSKEYSDGFGRLLQTRAQAEDVIFGNQIFGSSGLSANQNSTNAPAVGTERDENDPLNVVVSGWKIYNNKSEVVEQYEPFFDKGFDYTLPQLSTTGGVVPPQLGVKIKMFYDPLGRVVRTKNPDKSEQRVIYGIPNALNTPDKFTSTPWESYVYDANDLAPLTNPTNSNVPESHWFTPKSSLVDALGRTIETKEHKAHYNNDSSEYEDVVMRYFYDIRGNLLEVRDPYNRKVFEHVYDLRPAQEDSPLPPIWTRHIDSGEATILLDAMGKPIESSDAKDARSLNTYDTLSRPVNGWSQNNGSNSLRLTAHAIYGEEATDPKDSNLLGQLWQQYDESGKIETVEFDFKGNLLSKKQLVISSAVLKTALDNYQTYLVDWTGLPSILGTQEFETSSDFDALNRPVKITLPENVNTERKEIIPSYNRAGGLEKVHYDGTVYVNNIVYNAKGQRLLIAFCNNVMTRYVYSNSTFRLLRQKSEKFTYSHAGSNHNYTPQAGTNRQDDAFNFDLLGNIMKILHRTTDCGISGTSAGSDALNRDFDYDPLYRVTSANGRESDTQNQNDYLYTDAPNPGTPNSNNVRAYTRKYSFDKLGNVQQVKQLGTNGFTRNFVYNTGGNTLQKIETAAPALLEDFTYDNCGNQITAGTTRNYVWNAANQLITYKNQVDSNDPSIFAQYDYDGGGNRVSKVVRTGSAGSPIYERTIYIDGVFEYHILENGTTYEKNYVHVMDASASSATSRVAMVRVGDQFPDDIVDSVTYNLEDQIGSSSMRLNTSGSVIDKEEYYPFGDSSLRTFSKKRYRYVGKEKDLESGLYYYGARYYSAWTCRFISVDPLAPKYTELTPYQYSSNNPVSMREIEGLEGANVNANTRNYPVSSRPLGDMFKDWIPYYYSSAVMDPARNATIYWNPTSDYLGTGIKGGPFIQHGQWNFNTTSNTDIDVVNEGIVDKKTSGIVQRNAVGDAFQAGNANPATALVTVVDAATVALTAPVPPPVVNTNTVSGSPITTDPIFSNDGMTQVSTTTTVEQEITQTTTSRNVVVISFNTTQNPATDHNIIGTLQQRFDALNAAAGGNLVYNPALNQFGLTSAAMGGSVNETVISTGVQSTTTQTTTTTTTTETTTGQFDLMR